MSKVHYYVDFHVLQTVPPSCVNRDDTGSPKTAQYGGVTRARVSSQAWKHAMRLMFKEIFEPEVLGSRTKRAVDLVAKKLEEINPGCKAQAMAKKALENAGLKLKKEDDSTEALFFLSDAQAEALAKLAAAGEEEKQRYKEALKEQPSVDMALFGRMVASDPSLNYDAAAQVAHAISTHAVQNEYDYFTAVDDEAPEDNAGAGHLGTVEFNSSTLYRYATINLGELAKHLGEDTARTVSCFGRAFAMTMPTGKKNTFANNTVPALVYVTIREDQPVNLAGAFEEPVWSDHGYVKASVKKLSEYAEKTYEEFTGEPLLALVCGGGEEAKDLGEKMPLPKLLNQLEEKTKELLGKTEEV